MKRILFSLLLLIGSASLFAQSTGFDGLGLRLGAGLETGGYPALQGGLFARYQLAPNWVLQAELAGSLHETLPLRSYAYAVGQNPDGSKDSVATEVDIRQRYNLNLPVLLSYRVGKHLEFFGGAQASFLFGTGSVVYHRQYREAEGGYQLVQTDSESQGSRFDGLDRWDLAVVLGAKVNITPAWGLELRQTYGLNDVSSQALYGPRRDFNRSLTLSLTYKFWQK
jgi:hypothetical protein